MSAMDNRAIKTIAILGVFSFVFLWIIGSNLQSILPTVPTEKARVDRPRSPFDGRRAYNDFKRILALGPHPARSETLDALRASIRTELQEAGLEVQVLPIEGGGCAVLGKVKGTQSGIALLTADCDSQSFASSQRRTAASSAWLLEMARCLGPQREGFSLWLAFLEAEDPDAFATLERFGGGRAIIEQLKKDDRLKDLRATIHLDLSAACDLGIATDPDAPPELIRAVWDAARDTEHRPYFRPQERPCPGGHAVFRQVQIPSLNLIDFPPLGAHVSANSPEGTCWESLQIVGDVIYHALSQIDSWPRRHAKR